MTHVLPPLPWAENALEPTISAETIRFHYGKHHQGYVNKLNAAVDGTERAADSLETLILETDGGLFNNAAQVWNHTFYWNGLSPDGGNGPEGELAAAIDQAFGSLDTFKQEFSAAAAGNFGSGWTWLVRNSDGGLEIVNTDDADNPMRAGYTPLWCADVWEHAYYIDYRNDRGGYLDALWGIVNWQFIADNFSG